MTATYADTTTFAEGLKHPGHGNQKIHGRRGGGGGGGVTPSAEFLAAENGIRRKSVEHMVVQGADGKIYTHTNNRSDMVEPTAEMRAAGNGGIESHNHPRGGADPPSPPDVQLGIVDGAAEIRVVTAKETFSIKPPAGGWDATKQGRSMAVQQAYPPSIWVLHMGGGTTAQIATALDNLWQEQSRIHGYSYTRTAFSGKAAMDWGFTMKAKGGGKPDMALDQPIETREEYEEWQRKILAQVRKKELGEKRIYARDRRGRFTTVKGAYDLMASGQYADLDPTKVDDFLDYAMDKESVNLNKLNVYGPGNENIFDEHLTNLPRSAMPQLPESPGGLKEFETFANNQGYRTSYKTVDPRALVATQGELDSRKVASIHDYLRSNNGDLKDTGGTLLASAEMGVVDGHHRWAATAAYAVNNPGTVVDILQVDGPIHEVLEVAHAFAELKGIPRKGFGDVMEPGGPQATKADEKAEEYEDDRHIATDDSDWWYEEWHELRKAGATVEEANAEMQRRYGPWPFDSGSKALGYKHPGHGTQKVHGRRAGGSIEGLSSELAGKLAPGAIVDMAGMGEVEAQDALTELNALADEWPQNAKQLMFVGSDAAYKGPASREIMSVLQSDPSILAVTATGGAFGGFGGVGQQAMVFKTTLSKDVLMKSNSAPGSVNLNLLNEGNAIKAVARHEFGHVITNRTLETGASPLKTIERSGPLRFYTETRDISLYAKGSPKEAVAEAFAAAKYAVPEVASLPIVQDINAALLRSAEVMGGKTR